MDLAIASRSRKPIYFFLLIALAPLILALFGTLVRFKENERALRVFPEARPELVAASREEAWITTYIGAAGSALVGLIGVTGLALKKNRKA